MKMNDALRNRHCLLQLAAIFLAFPLAAVSAKAQQTTDARCSPAATQSLDSKYLPPAEPKFGGEINLNAKDSKPCWEPRVVPPKGAPNVLLNHD